MEISETIGMIPVITMMVNMIIDIEESPS